MNMLSDLREENHSPKRGQNIWKLLTNTLTSFDCILLYCASPMFKGKNLYQQQGYNVFYSGGGEPNLQNLWGIHIYKRFYKKSLNIWKILWRYSIIRHK